MRLTIVLTVVFISLLLAGLSFIGVFKPTGMAVYKGAEIEEDVEKEISEKGEVRVILELENFTDIEDLNKINENKDLKIKSGIIKKDKFNKLKSNKNIKNIFLDQIFTLHLQDSAPLIGASKVQSLKINDINITGNGNSVCILDTGIDYKNSDLGGCANISGCNRIIGYDFINNNNDPMDDNGHGTHVAGIVGANNGIKGIAPDAKIIALKVCNSVGLCYLSNILSAIDWCTKNKEIYNISAISMSFGGGLYTDYCDSSISILSDSINSAVNKNIAVVASSGNSGSTTQIAAPACIKNVISVASTTKQDAVSSFSNVNSITDLLAPGSNINSTLGICLNGCSCSGSYMVCSGTSMSAPHVSGAIALLQQYKKGESNTELTPSEIKNTLKNNGKSIIYNNFNLTRIDVYKALISIDAKKPDISLDTTPVKIEFGSANNVSVNFTAKDTNLNNYNLTIYYPNSSILGVYNVSIVLTKNNLTETGNYTLTAYADDLNKNFNIISKGLLVKNAQNQTNITNLTVTLDYPIDNSTSSTNNITLSCSANDSSAISNISLYNNINGIFSLNSTIYLSNLSVNSYSASFSFSNINNTIIIWNCLASDINGSSAFSAKNYTLNIKLNQAPSIISYSPASPIAINENENITFNQTSKDKDGDALTYAWLVDNLPKATTQNYSYIADHSSIGVHNITLIVSDGLLTTSQYWNVTVNQLPQQSQSSGGGGGGGGGGGSSSAEPVNELKITTEATKEINKPLTGEAGPQASTPIIIVPEEPQRLTGYIIFGNIFGNLRYNLLILLLLLSLLLYLYRIEIKKLLKRT